MHCPRLTVTSNARELALHACHAATSYVSMAVNSIQEHLDRL
jgi:hypothetical protein